MIEIINSTWINAMLTLLINMGSSYVISDVQNIFKGVFSYKFMIWLVVFAICFLSTKDVYVSIYMSLIFSILVWILLDKQNPKTIPQFKRDIKQYIKNLLLNIDKSVEYESRTVKQSGY